ncbi:MAG TPA: glycosyltransferase family 2 protein [Nocardioidaceae bacterium]|nr:glycosyltransferase family 2 protein [Nocardioidaceae bacterium]
MTTSVTALLVSHDGARWLPGVLDALGAQTRPVDHVVAVDTGSTDRSVPLLRERLGSGPVLDLPAKSSYAAAVAAGLDAVPPDGADDWVWLLHDDSAPASDALEKLLSTAGENPSADVLGPKLREWPSLRRLLEVGVTISGTGQRETGLERGEYDQGQHDRVRDVLAVHTAGMLVRREALDRLGFDKRLPLFGNDIDFGWRAARAGLRTIVAPDAVVFHVEAAHRGLRQTPLTASGFGRGERRAALFTLLVNCSTLAFPVLLVRLLLGSLVRALGMLLVRAPGEALDEVLAMAAVYVHPLRILVGRHRRRKAASVPAREVRRLLPPVWTPYRHGLDFVVDVATAIGHQAGDVTSARRARNRAVEQSEGIEAGPASDEAQNLPADSGLLARLLRNPAALMIGGLVVLALVCARGLYGGGLLSGGALLPAPHSSLDWWRLYLSGQHPVGVGSTAPAAPYLVPLAVAGTILLGKAWLVVDLIFLMAVPLCALGAHRALRAMTGSGPLSLWGALAYGVLPVVTGAVQQGRLGTVAGAIVLPWLVRSALGLAPDRPVERRWRAVWRTSLWLALLVAFVPLAWAIAAALALLAVAAGLVGDRARWSSPSVWGAALVPVVVALVLLVPWTATTWTHRGLTSLVFEAGLPAPELADALTRWDVVVGRPGLGAPGWLSIGIMLAAVVALVRHDTRPAVLRAWLVVVVGLAVVVVLAPATFHPAGDPTGQPVWLGFPLLLVQASGIAAAALAGTGARRRLSGISFGWRQPLGVLVVAAAALSPLAGLGWWVATGSADPLTSTRATQVPTYMSDAAATDPGKGILVVRGSRSTRFEYVLLHGAGRRLGEDSVRPTASDERSLTRLVTDLTTGPQPEDVRSLAAHGVAFVYAPAPADVVLVGNMDSASGVTPGSAVHRGSRAWQIQAAVSGRPAQRPSPDTPRFWLLIAQALAVLVVLVLAAPSRRIVR